MSSGVPRDLVSITFRCWSLIFLSPAYVGLYSLMLCCTTHLPLCIHLHHFYVNTSLFSSLQVCSLFRILYILYFTEIPTLYLHFSFQSCIQLCYLFAYVCLPKPLSTGEIYTLFYINMSSGDFVLYCPFYSKGALLHFM